MRKASNIKEMFDNLNIFVQRLGELIEEFDTNQYDYEGRGVGFYIDIINCSEFVKLEGIKLETSENLINVGNKRNPFWVGLRRHFYYHKNLSTPIIFHGFWSENRVLQTPVPFLDQ